MGLWAGISMRGLFQPLCSLIRLVLFQVQEPAYQLVRLLSDIGGIMGLWAGISVIALVETLLFFIQLLGFGFDTSKQIKTKVDLSTHNEEQNKLEKD